MVRIKFNKLASLIFLDTIIAGKKKSQEMFVRLVLDTGSVATVVSYDLMEYLGYAPEKSRRTGRLITGSGVEYAPIITVTKMSVGGESLKNVEVHCHNFPAESYVDGVIGLNFLRHFNFEINYDQGEVILKRKK